jgi:hypothetical protein
MKGTTIMIGLLGKPMGKHKAEGGLLESEMEMPEALVDESVNRANKANAVMKAQYGPAEGKQMCGNCEYFDTDYQLPKGQGFCQVYEFSCSDKNVCLAWEFDKEEKSEEESEEESD